MILLVGSVNAYFMNIQDTSIKNYTISKFIYDIDSTTNTSNLVLTIPPGIYGISSHSAILRSLSDEKSIAFWGTGRDIGTRLGVATNYVLRWQGAVCYEITTESSVDVNNYIILERYTSSNYDWYGSGLTPTGYVEKSNVYYVSGNVTNYRTGCTTMRDGERIDITVWSNLTNGSMTDISTLTNSISKVEFSYRGIDVSENLDYLQNVKKDSNYKRNVQNTLYTINSIIVAVVDLIIELWFIAYWIFKMLAITFVIGIIFYSFIFLYKLFKTLVENE
jgi:hypothetical protein